MIYYALTPKVKAILKKKYFSVFERNDKKDILMVKTDDRERGSTHDGNKEFSVGENQNSVGESAEQE